MKTLSDIQALRQQISSWKKQNHRVAFVPTMGNLHAGHLRLVEEARKNSRKVVVSIFVNPMQFEPGSDFENYPRTMEKDASALEDSAVDVLYCPAVETIYPQGIDAVTRVEVPGCSKILCGAFRPGHFVGVATVVLKLLQLVQPDVSIFGEKDFQQLTVIKKMVADLCVPVEIIGVPTVREKDGLAMSSRNRYLTNEQRQKAGLIHKILLEACDAVRTSGQAFSQIEKAAIQKLVVYSFRPDYFSIRRDDSLEAPAKGDHNLVILVAAWLGDARLIDNMRIKI